MSSPRVVSVVLVGSEHATWSAALRGDGSGAIPRRFVRTKTIQDALGERPDLVIVTSPQERAQEQMLIAHDGRRELCSLFVSDDPRRTVALLRAGAGDVIGPEASSDELTCRIERLLRLRDERTQDLRQLTDLEALAYTDWLTSLHNRRFFEQVLARDVSRANRYRRPLSVVLMDLDEFKRVNDLLGHEAGDQLLQSLGDVLRRNTRQCDCAARIGGDEFAVVLGDIDASGAHIYSSRVAKAFASVPDLPQHPDIHASLSTGISSIGLSETSPATLLQQADRALYRAKRQGRGRIEISRW